MDIIFKSLLAGIVTGIILLIAKFSGPRIAGVIGGVPLIFAISYILITLKDKTAAKDFLIGGTLAAIASIFFNLLLIWLNIQFTKSHWLNFTIAYIFCFAFAFLLLHFIKIK